MGNEASNNGKPKTPVKREKAKHDHGPKCLHPQMQHCIDCNVVFCANCQLEWVPAKTPAPFPSHWPMNPGNYQEPAIDLGPTCVPVEAPKPARTQFVCAHH